MAHSTATTLRRNGSKPRKPHKDYPLTPHGSGKWCKKIKGKLYYFGRWDDPAGALEEYLAAKDDILAGRDPRKDPTKITIADVCNSFLSSKKTSLDIAEIGPRTFKDYYNTAERLVRVFGRNTAVETLTSQDFETLRADIASKWGLVRLGNEIIRTRMLFRYAYESGLVDKLVRFGPHFKAPGTKAIRRHRNGRQSSMVFAANEIRALLEYADDLFKAMILLGINAALGNTDCISLRPKHLKDGFLDYPRPKTGVPRRCPLWTETLAAIEAAGPGDDIVFHGMTESRMAHAFRDIQRRADVYQAARGFYNLRHSFATSASGALDEVAVRLIMGHADASMLGNYRHGIDDSRLVAVTRHVHAWMWS